MNTSKLNIKVTVSDYNGDEIISRNFGTDYYDDEEVTHAILKTIEDADEYICDDCWNTGDYCIDPSGQDYEKCHCVEESKYQKDMPGFEGTTEALNNLTIN